MIFAINSKEKDIIYEVINRIDTNVLTDSFYGCEFHILRQMYLHLISESYSVAYEFFLKRMNPIWKNRNMVINL